ncbi:hypothetical protein ACLBQC_32185, partial [Klebsiella pneumoniae]|uniref:hypothetical protein n=1 Tax=Klebsiella pneumoniae TaxID=573 RepID=UPI003968A4E2
KRSGTEASAHRAKPHRQTWTSEPLSPVEGKTYETGIKGELADGRLLALAGPHLPGRSEEVVAARRRGGAHVSIAASPS